MGFQVWSGPVSCGTGLFFIPEQAGIIYLIAVGEILLYRSCFDSSKILNFPTEFLSGWI